MRIEKKSWPELFEQISKGEKDFDVRIADFEISEGDVLVLKEWDPEIKDYTGRQIEKEINYVLRTKEQKFWSPEDIEKYGFFVISFK